jgi:hypothetical protein
MSGGRRAVHKPEIAHERQRRCAGRQPVANWQITSGNCANCGNSWTRLSAWPLPRDFDANWRITSGNCGNCGNRCCAARSAPPPVDPTSPPAQLARISAIVPLE